MESTQLSGVIIGAITMCQNRLGLQLDHLSRLMGKPTMWFTNRSDTNQAVQVQKQARSMIFRI